MVYFQKQRHPFTTSASHSGRFSITDDHLWAQLEQLCSRANHAPVTNAANRHYIWLDDFWMDPATLQTALIDLQAQNAVPYLVQIITVDELYLPFRGHMLYEDMTGAEKVDIPLVESITEEYRARITAHLRATDDICRRLGLYHIRLILGDTRDLPLPAHSTDSMSTLLEDMMAAIAVPRSGIMA